VVFKITPEGTESIVYAFSGAADGQMPFALVQGANGNLYGGTWYGGQGYGIIFEVTPSGQETILQSFSNTDGGWPTHCAVFFQRLFRHEPPRRAA
jgi:uncharacterized repeat protein (TIGR03803 family)